VSTILDALRRLQSDREEGSVERDLGERLTAPAAAARRGRWRLRGAWLGTASILGSLSLGVALGVWTFSGAMFSVAHNVSNAVSASHRLLAPPAGPEPPRQNRSATVPRLGAIERHSLREPGEPGSPGAASDSPAAADPAGEARTNLPVQAPGIPANSAPPPPPFEPRERLAANPASESAAGVLSRVADSRPVDPTASSFRAIAERRGPLAEPTNPLRAAERPSRGALQRPRRAAPTRAPVPSPAEPSRSAPAKSEKRPPRSAPATPPLAPPREASASEIPPDSPVDDPLGFPNLVVSSVRWHPDPKRREATVEVDGAVAISAKEGDLVGGALLAKIGPGEVEFRVGMRSKTVHVGQ
jgi:hypothetical protein